MEEPAALHEDPNKKEISFERIYQKMKKEENSIRPASAGREPPALAGGE